MTNRKFLLSVSSLALAGFLVAPAAFAASITVTQSNTNTGPHSTNKNTVTITNHEGSGCCESSCDCGHWWCSKSGSVHVDNDIHIHASTGGNKIIGNTTVGGGITSGDVNIGITLTNTV